MNAPSDQPKGSETPLASTPLGPEGTVTIPDHQLLHRIGGGSYGEVWLTRNALGAFRATKIIHRKSFEDSRPFEREFNGLLKFEPISRSHEGLVDILQVGRHENYFYYVMELADGEEMQNEECKMKNEGATNPTASDRRQSALDSEFSILDYRPKTLRSLLRPNPQLSTFNSQPTPRRLPADQCVQIGLALTSALAHLHKHGLVHRDVKPSNIIFVQGALKLADIGLVTDADTTLSYVGTEGYIPPEGPGAVQADIFSLGKVLYEMATGQDRRQFPDLPPNLQGWSDQAGVLELNEVLVKACARDATLRYQSCEEMHVDFALLKRGESVKRERTREHRRRAARRFAGWLIAGLVVVTLILLGSRVRQTAALPRAERLSKNAVANDFYDRGKKYFDKLRGTNFQMAVYCFEQAINLEPNFAEAFARLAETYSWSDGEWNPGWKFFPKAKEYAEKARALNPSLAEPHYVLSCYYAMMKWDWEKAEKEGKLGIDLNPTPASHLGYAEFLRIVGRTDEALVEIAKAKKNDDRSITVNYRLAGYLADARRFEDALKQIDQALVLDPDLRVSGFRQNIFCAQGRYREAVELEWASGKARGASSEELERDLGELKRTPETDLPKAYWHRQLEEAKRENYGPYWEARAYAQLGEADEAIRCLQQAFENHDTQLTFYVMTDWALDPVRSVPRFDEILKAMGLK